MLETIRDYPVINISNVSLLATKNTYCDGGPGIRVDYGDFNKFPSSAVYKAAYPDDNAWTNTVDYPKNAVDKKYYYYDISESQESSRWKEATPRTSATFDNGKYKPSGSTTSYQIFKKVTNS